MGRRSYLDSDEERLPEGMTRVGYDADEGVYTYRDTDGSRWQGVPGQRYGPMFRVKEPSYASQSSPPRVEPPAGVWQDLDPTGQNGNLDSVRDWLDTKSELESTFDDDIPNGDQKLTLNERLQAINAWARKPIPLGSRMPDPSPDESNDSDEKQDDDDDDDGNQDTDPALMGKFPEDQVRRRTRYLERHRREKKRQSQGGGLLRLGRLIEDIEDTLPLRSLTSAKSGLSRVATMVSRPSRKASTINYTGMNRRNTVS